MTSRRTILIVVAAVLAGAIAVIMLRARRPEPHVPRFAIAIHGGAGTILRKDMTPDRERAYRAALGQALEAGQTVLAAGGTSSDAVVAAITVMEDSPLFNAGKGAVFTSEGKNELDASIMEGDSLRAGAVTGVTTVKNPIELARAVMDRSPHVMLQGPGAEVFAREQGLEIVEPSYFFTETRWQQLQKLKAGKQQGAMLDHDGQHRFGTVGAVALDVHGNLAAGTSTGGMTNKRWGRVGDSPIVGAGTYASNRSCAVSGTGHGEYFIRATVARDVAAHMELAGNSLGEAAHRVVMQNLVDLGGDGGVIAVDRHGNVAMVFNTAGMYRASVRDGEQPVIAIYGDSSGDD